jgi:ketosteroid isomerase-like protein
MMTRILLVALLALPAAAQAATCSEQFIKNEGPKPGAAAYADDEYFFSGALKKPVVGGAAINKASEPVAASRKNEDLGSPKADRIVVAPSGDMAYEYGTNHMSFDSKEDGKHADFTAAYIRVWRVIGGSCKIAAEMFEPENQ